MSDFNGKFAGGSESDDLRNDGLIQAGWTITMGDFGITEASQTRIFSRHEFDDEQIEDKAYDFLDTEHSYAPWLKCKNASVKYGDGGYYAVELSYKGVYQETATAIYSIEAGTSEEPIATHPKFAEIAGKPSETDPALGFVPSTGAVFSGTNDLEATFEKFVRTGDSNDGTQDDSLVGLSGYLHPDIIFTEQRTLGRGLDSGDIKQLIDDIGERYDNVHDTIIDPTGQTTDIPEFFPEDFDEANFLLISADYEPQGDGGVLTRKWRMSGRYGWNELMYAKGKDSIGGATNENQKFGNGGEALNSGNMDRIRKSGDFADTDKRPLDAQLSVNEDNEVEATWRFIVEYGAGMDLAKDYYTGSKTHTLDFLSPTQIIITGVEGGQESVAITFKGVREEGEWKPTISVSTQVEPIEAHPNFHSAQSDDDVIGGNRTDPKNGAKFNENKTFDKFSQYVAEDLDTQGWWKTKIDDEQIIDGHMPNALAGVQSYMEIGVEWKEVKYYDNIQKAIDEVKKIGMIQDPQVTDPAVPTLRSRVRSSGNRNWLITSVSFEMVGSSTESGYKVSMTYRLSGGRGWNTDIYEEA